MFHRQKTDKIQNLTSFTLHMKTRICFSRKISSHSTCLAYLYIYSGLLKYCDFQELFCSLSNWVLKLTKTFLNFIFENSMSKIVQIKNKSHH